MRVDDPDTAIAKLQPYAEDRVYTGANGEIGVLCAVPEAYADFAAEASRWSDGRDFGFERDTRRTTGSSMPMCCTRFAFRK